MISRPVISRPPVMKNVEELNNHIIALKNEFNDFRDRKNHECFFINWDMKTFLGKLDVEMVRLMKINKNAPLTEENMQGIRQILAERHIALANSPWDYNLSPRDDLNQLFLSLSQILEQVICRYQLLMPSIEFTTSDILLNDLKDDENQLRHFILDDNNKRPIYIIPTLEYYQKTGQFWHLVWAEGQTRLLSEEEKIRVINHSKYTKAYYDAICKLMEAKTKRISFGSILQSFSMALVDGGVGITAQKHDAIVTAKKRMKDNNEQINQDSYSKETLDSVNIPDRETAEKNAQQSANIAVVEFINWYGSLNVRDKIVLNEITSNEILSVLSSIMNFKQANIVKLNSKPTNKNTQGWDAKHGLYVRYKDKLYFITKNIVIKHKKGQYINKNVCTRVHGFSVVKKQFDEMIKELSDVPKKLSLVQCQQLWALTGHANVDLVNSGECVVTLSCTIDTMLTKYKEKLFSTYPGELKNHDVEGLEKTLDKLSDIRDQHSYKTLENLCELKLEELKFWMKLTDYPLSRAVTQSTITNNNELVIFTPLSLNQSILSTRTDSAEIESLLISLFKDGRLKKELEHFNKDYLTKINFKNVFLKLDLMNYIDTVLMTKLIDKIEPQFSDFEDYVDLHKQLKEKNQQLFVDYIKIRHPTWFEDYNNLCTSADRFITVLQMCLMEKRKEIVQDFLKSNRLVDFIKDSKSLETLFVLLKDQLMMRNVVDYLNQSSTPLKALIQTAAALEKIMKNCHYSILTPLLKSLDLPALIKNRWDYDRIENCMRSYNEVESESAYTYFCIELAPHMCKINNLKHAHRGSMPFNVFFYPEAETMAEIIKSSGQDSTNISVNVAVNITATANPTRSATQQFGLFANSTSQSEVKVTVVDDNQNASQIRPGLGNTAS